MIRGRMIVISGSPGTGKTTIARIMAEESVMEKSVHMHTDDFYRYLAKGCVPPHLPESHEQNRIVIEAFLQAAKRYADGGYDVIIDGVVGPWLLEPWQELAAQGYEIHYLILRASEQETMRRAIARTKLDRATNEAIVTAMWKQFCTLGEYERHVVETDAFSVQETVSKVQEIVASRTVLL